MIRHRFASARFAAVALATAVLIVAFPAARAHAADQPESEATPLAVQLARLDPGVLPRRGTITLAGTVRNVSEETWSAINVHPFVSPTPITDRAALAEAAATPAESEVGTRLVDEGQFAAIGDLEPGASARFRISIRVADLGASEPGVYWIGVHALGQNAQGRQVGGRARAFIPRLPPDRAGKLRSLVALVVPIREPVRRDADGALRNPSTWSRSLAPDGRLRRIVDLLASANGSPAAILADPAVVEAVEGIAEDRSGLSFGTAEPETGADSESGSDDGETSQAADPTRAYHRLDAADRLNAAAWMATFRTAASPRPLLRLGYGDPDVSGLARRDANLLERSAAMSADVAERLRLTSIPAVAPTNGWLDPESLDKLDKRSVVLVSDHGVPRARTTWRAPTGQDLLFTDAWASSGGPGPGDRLDALAVRQRILADAALRARRTPRTPLVVELPSDWDPGVDWQSADFFAGLDQPWLGLTSVNSGLDMITPDFAGTLPYPERARKVEVAAPQVAAAEQLIDIGAALGSMLRTDNQIEHQTAAIALSAVSHHARGQRQRVTAQVQEVDEALQDQLAGIEVVGTDFVTLSGGTGTVSVTLVNGLTQPVTVGVRASSDDTRVQLSQPDPVELGPQESAVLRVKVDGSDIGVHAVTVTPTAPDGQSLGTPLTFNLRTSQVGTLIWIVLGAGAALLVVMIGRRVMRGLREHRWRGQ